MPYITQDQKNRFEEDSKGGFIDLISEISHKCSTAGELNYIITSICQDYIKTHGKKYQYMNDVIGALEGAKLEFYRRIVADYEDLKIKENGDVMRIQ